MDRPDHTIMSASGSHVTVRMAGDGDSASLTRLAALDSATLPAGPMLLAEVDGEAAAALPIAGGPAVADPFRRTSEAVELLELRAAQLRGHEGSPSFLSASGGRLRALARMPRAAPLRPR